MPSAATPAAPPVVAAAANPGAAAGERRRIGADPAGHRARPLGSLHRLLGRCRGASGGDPNSPPWQRPPGQYESVKPKDFVQIADFDGDIVRFADWADRMGAKLTRMHPRMLAVLEWAERHPAVITEQVE